jgi:hypothetical protein
MSEKKGSKWKLSKGARSKVEQTDRKRSGLGRLTNVVGGNGTIEYTMMMAMIAAVGTAVMKAVGKQIADRAEKTAEEVAKLP